jgi:hypothetical protein
MLHVVGDGILDEITLSGNKLPCMFTTKGNDMG